MVKVNSEPLRLPHLFLMIFASITLLVLIVPFMVTPGSLVNLDGRVGIIDHADIWNEQDIITGLIYRTGDYFCHQMEERSYLLNGNQLPVCVRDLGLLLGFTLASFPLIWIDRRISWWMITAFVLPIIVDGGVQTLMDYQSQNLIRLTTGILGGVGAFLGMMKIMQNWMNELEKG